MGKVTENYAAFLYDAHLDVPDGKGAHAVKDDMSPVGDAMLRHMTFEEIESVHGFCMENLGFEQMMWEVDNPAVPYSSRGWSKVMHAVAEEAHRHVPECVILQLGNKDKDAPLKELAETANDLAGVLVAPVMVVITDVETNPDKPREAILARGHADPVLYLRGVGDAAVHAAIPVEDGTFLKGPKLQTYDRVKEMWAWNNGASLTTTCRHAVESKEISKLVLDQRSVDGLKADAKHLGEHDELRGLCERAKNRASEVARLQREVHEQEQKHRNDMTR